MSVAELAHEAEARGFSSLYLPEHTHIPVNRGTPPPAGEAVLPEERQDVSGCAEHSDTTPEPDPHPGGYHEERQQHDVN
jgi:alkanesulfonate monooxygenase SsuD/methylene tetrahydromethanopterin reductase-like flavin-dependent oxidoreductase (luciferase family)